MADPSSPIMPPSTTTSPLLSPRRTNTSTSTADKATNAAETCRICRSESTPEEPLFHPCKCSGSIKHVHQECLMEWLSHSHKKHCELCKTPFTFTKLYDAQMPEQLPWSVFLRRAVVHLVWGFGRLARGGLVGVMWLVVLPWLIRWAWRWMFWVADAGWAREAFMKKFREARLEEGNTRVNETAFSFTGDWGLEHVMNMTINYKKADGSEVGEVGPFVYQAIKDVFSKSFGFQSDAGNNAFSNAAAPAPYASADTSLLSSLSYLSELTPSARVNRVILDICEGQLITCVVITGFILVFLIREWVVQQQPLVNLENLGNVQQQLREAAERVEADDNRLRRQQELLEQARRRLLELRDETDNLKDLAGLNPPAEEVEGEYGGWEAIESLIDHATAHLSKQGEGEQEKFKFCAQAVLKQIRIAGHKGVDMDDLAAKIGDKLATLSTDERGEWESILYTELRRVTLQSPIGEGRRKRASSDPTDPTRQSPKAKRLYEPVKSGEMPKRRDTSPIATRASGEGSGNAPRRPRMPDRDFSSRATHIQRLLEEAEGIFSPQDASRTREAAQRLQGGEGASDGEAAGAVSPPSSAGSWQHVTSPNEPASASSPAGSSSAPKAASLSRAQLPDHEDQPDFDVEELPITNAGPDAKINIKRSGKGKARAVPPPKETTPAETKKREEEDKAMKVLEEELKAEGEVMGKIEKELESEDRDENGNEGEEAKKSGMLKVEADDDEEMVRRKEKAAKFLAGNPFFFAGSAPEAERREKDEVVPSVLSAEEAEGMRRAEMGPDADTTGQQEQQREGEGDGEEDEEQTERRPPLPPTTFQRLADWFWGDIQAPDTVEAPPADNEERLDGNGEQEAPFVPVQNGQLAIVPAPADHNQPHADDHAHVPHDPENEQEHDPEVLAAAQAAGLDAEALEEAEDLEGIFELVGLQGPLIGLFQTSTFCTVLVTGTVFAAIGLPYVWGKMVLSFIGSPVWFAMKMPLSLAGWVADVVVDVTLLLGGYLVLVSAFVAESVLVLLGQWIKSLKGVRIAEWVADSAMSIAGKSGGRLQELFLTTEPVEEEIMGWNFAFLGASVHAHASLRELEEEVSAVLQWMGDGVTAVVETISSPGSMTNFWHATFETLSQATNNLQPFLFAGLETLEQYINPILTSFGLLKSTGSLSFETPSIPIDPTLIYWSSTDRTLAVATGYLSLALLAAIYVVADTPITRSEPSQAFEKLIRDTLRQAGGVLKVILIISIEMLVFPFYCGLLLDLAFLPLFAGATVAGRWQFAVGMPYTFCFVHWFVGTCYMFHFALFVGMCRKILRKGVLWFIRDPDDPTFHPVRDVLERNVMTQLRKIGFSALVYGALVILCLGGVIWGIGEVFEGIFPVHWVSTEPVLEFPMDLLLYNAVTPLVVRLFKPSDAVNTMYAWWLRRCARVLRLSHFLFDDRRKDEEGHYVRKSWSSFLLMRKAPLDQQDTTKAPRITATADEEKAEVYFQHDGKYVLTPCNDQYRPPKPGEAFLHSTADSSNSDSNGEAGQDGEGDVYIADKDGKRNEHFAKVYVPPFFRLRVTLFMVCLWMFSALTGLCATLVPLCFGRTVFASFMPEGMRVNDIYAYTVGAYILGGLLFGLLQSRPAIKYVRENSSALNLGAWSAKAKKYALQVLKCAYVYGFIGIVLPTVFALVLQFYFILPLHTYIVSVASTASNNRSATSAVSNAATSLPNTTLNTGPFNFTMLATATQPPQLPTLAAHTIHILQDYCLGLLYVRLAARYVLASPSSRAAEAFRRVTADGYFNPDIKLATRFLIAPLTILSAFVLLFPPVLARLGLALASLHSTEAGKLLVGDAQTAFYRYSYPMIAGLFVLLLCTSEIGRATSRWRARIRDEVYLVGERLHNFGEKRPPPGSRSVVRKDR